MSKEKKLLDKIVDLTASYAFVAYGWDLKAEEDLSDYKEELLKLLNEEP